MPCSATPDAGDYSDGPEKFNLRQRTPEGCGARPGVGFLTALIYLQGLPPAGADRPAPPTPRKAGAGSSFCGMAAVPAATVCPASASMIASFSGNGAGTVKPISILAAGDICPGDHYFSLGHGTGSRIAAGVDPFREIAPLLAEADLCIANLECPLAAGSVRGSGPEGHVFRGPPATAALLQRSGFDLLHVANNHILQHGADAFDATLASLHDSGLQTLGLLDVGSTARPVVRVVDGLRLGFLGYSFVDECHEPGQLRYASGPLQQAIDDIEALRTTVDCVVASVHWGEEGLGIPVPAVTAAARRMVDAGAVLVLGHHPHVFQPVERVGNALIAYSLGDFVFDLFWDRRLVESALLHVRLDAAGVVDHRITPVRLDRDYCVRVQSDRDAERFLRDLERNAMLLHSGDADTALVAQRRAVQAMQWRKLAYFLGSSLRGDRRRKAAFILSKLKRATAAPGTGG